MFTPRRSTPLSGSRVARGAAALLCLAVTVIHVIDQGGLPGKKRPTYIGVGYYLLELAGVLAAVLLLRSGSRVGWLLSIGVALGPMLGYILSRGPGMPNYTEDKGNWAEPLGMSSLVVETVLLLLAVAAAVVPAARPASTTTESSLARR